MNQRPPIDVHPDHWAIVTGILQTLIPEREVWAFGSRARGNAKKYSDLDLAVVSQTPLGLVGMAALADAFSQSDLPYKVDVVDWAQASDRFRKIIEEQKVMVQSPSAPLS